MEILLVFLFIPAIVKLVKVLFGAACHIIGGLFAVLGAILDSITAAGARAEKQRQIEAAQAQRRQQLTAKEQAKQERMEAAKRAERKSKEAAKRAEEEKRKAEERRQSRISELTAEKTTLNTELANLKGLFSGKRRKEIETRLSEIDTELKKLSQ